MCFIKKTFVALWVNKPTQCVSLIGNVVRYQYNLIRMSCQKLTQNLHTSKMGGRMIEIQWLYKHLLLSGKINILGTKRVSRKMGAYQMGVSLQMGQLAKYEGREAIWRIGQ